MWPDICGKHIQSNSRCCYLFGFYFAQDGLADIVNDLDDIKEENREELIDILDRYFDPEKQQIVPVAKKTAYQSRRRRSYRRDRKNKGDRDGDMPSTPDSTTRSPRKRRNRRQRDGQRRNSNKTSNSAADNDHKSDTQSQTTDIDVGGK